MDGLIEVKSARRGAAKSEFGREWDQRGEEDEMEKMIASSASCAPKFSNGRWKQGEREERRVLLEQVK